MPERDIVLKEERTLEELRTIQTLEESIGPRGFWQLRSVLEDDERQRLDSISARAFDRLRTLDEVIREWEAQVAPKEERVTAEEEFLNREELIDTFIELKESEAAILRRARDQAPNDRIRDLLGKMADAEEEAVERLRELL